MKRIRKQIDFSEKDIAEGKFTAWELIQPLFDNVNIYDSFEEYTSDLKPFTKAQRNIFAFMWYDAEVCNGGHDQFFYNSTGIVWKDVLDCFKMIGAVRYAENLQKAIDMFGGTIPFDREKRIEKLFAMTSNPDYDENNSDSKKYFDTFGEIDDFYYQDEDIDELMTDYIRNHPAEFVLHAEFMMFE